MELNEWKAGDEMWARFKKKGCKEVIEKVHIVGFNCMGVIIKGRGQLHFSKGLFYGFGYHNDNWQIIYVKDKKLFKSAILAEKLRLSLDRGLAEKFKLEY